MGKNVLRLPARKRKRALERMMTRATGYDITITPKGRKSFMLSTDVLCIDLRKRLESTMFLFQNDPTFTEFHDEQGSVLYVNFGKE